MKTYVKNIVIILILFSAIPNKVYSDENILTGTGLLRYCDSANKQDVFTCHMFILGVHEGITVEILLAAIANLDGTKEKDIWDLVMNRHKKPYCLPIETEKNQDMETDGIMGVVRKYLKSHIEELSGLSAGLIRKAWVEAFPCSVENEKSLQRK